MSSALTDVVPSAFALPAYGTEYAAAGKRAGAVAPVSVPDDLACGAEDGLDVRVGDYPPKRRIFGFMFIVLGFAACVAIAWVFPADGTLPLDLLIQGGLALLAMIVGFAMLLSLSRRVLEVDRAAKELRMRTEYFMCCRKGGEAETVPVALLGAMSCTLHRNSAKATASHVWLDVAYTGMTHALRLEDRAATGRESTLMLDWAAYFAALVPGPVRTVKVRSGKFTQSGSELVLASGGRSDVYRADAKAGRGVTYTSVKKLEPTQEGVTFGIQCDRYGGDSSVFGDDADGVTSRDSIEDADTAAAAVDEPLPLPLPMSKAAAKKVMADNAATEAAADKTASGNVATNAAADTPAAAPGKPAATAAAGTPAAASGAAASGKPAATAESDAPATASGKPAANAAAEAPATASSKPAATVQHLSGSFAQEHSEHAFAADFGDNGAADDDVDFGEMEFDEDAIGDGGGFGEFDFEGDG
jgi:hypothetical protein